MPRRRAKTELYLAAVQAAVAAPERWIEIPRRFETEANASVTARCLEGGYLRVRPRDDDTPVVIGGRRYLQTAAPVSTRVERDDVESAWRVFVRAQRAPNPLYDVLVEAAMSSSSDGLWLDGSGAVGVAATESGAYVGWVDVAWPGPSEPVLHLRDVVHIPRRLPGDVRSAIERAGELREAALRTCDYCGTRSTPGHMHADDTCQGCAERHLGVVH